MSKVNRTIQRQAKELAASSDFSYQQALNIITRESSNAKESYDTSLDLSRPRGWKAPVSIFAKPRLILERNILNYFHVRGFQDQTLEHFGLGSSTLMHNCISGAINIPIYDYDGKIYGGGATVQPVRANDYCQYCNKGYHPSDFTEKLFGEIHGVAYDHDHEGDIRAQKVTEFLDAYVANPDSIDTLACPDCGKEGQSLRRMLSQFHVTGSSNSPSDDGTPRPLYNAYNALKETRKTPESYLLLTPSINETWAAWQAGHLLTCSYDEQTLGIRADEENNISAHKAEKAVAIAKERAVPIVLLPSFYNPDPAQQLQQTVDALRAVDGEVAIEFLPKSHPLSREPLVDHWQEQKGNGEFSLTMTAPEYLVDMQQERGSKAVTAYLDTPSLEATPEAIAQAF